MKQLTVGHLKTVTVIISINRCPTVIVPAEEVERREAEYVLVRAGEIAEAAFKQEIDAARCEASAGSDEVGATFYWTADLTGKLSLQLDSDSKR